MDDFKDSFLTLSRKRIDKPKPLRLCDADTVTYTVSSNIWHLFNSLGLCCWSCCCITANCIWVLALGGRSGCPAALRGYSGCPSRAGGRPWSCARSTCGGNIPVRTRPLVLRIKSIIQSIKASQPRTSFIKYDNAGKTFFAYTYLLAQEQVRAVEAGFPVPAFAEPQ